MQASTAQVVDFEAYRRQRAASRAEAGRPQPAAVNQVPVFWYPMWMLVPVVMVAQ
jgi:hypothetical protein